MTLPPLSVVIPVFNEAGNVAHVVREAVQTLGPQFSLDIVVVDDGSSDETADVLQSLASDDGRVRVFRHPRRSGKSAALRTGFLNAMSPWVATMDGDGQNAATDVAAMAGRVDLARIGEVGLVAGIRQSRNDGASRMIASRIANRFRRALLKDDCPDTACGLKLIPRDVFLAMPFFDAIHRYMPAFVRRFGFQTINHLVSDRPRTSGQSKYTNLGRAFAGAVDLIGVVWLLRRTSVPAPALLVRSENGRIHPPRHS